MDWIQSILHISRQTTYSNFCGPLLDDFLKNTVYSIPEILFWKIRNEFLIYHTWNNGISEKIWKITQGSNKTIWVCGNAPTRLYPKLHITYQQSSSSFHLEKYLFTENDIYFSEQIFISLNINLKLKSALRTKYLFYRTLH